MTFAVRHDHVGITVRPADVPATIDWYARHLGFSVQKSFTMHGTTFTFLVSGEAKIELLASAESGPGEPSKDVLASMSASRLHHLCLAVDDLERSITDLVDGGVAVIGGPMDITPTGQRIAFVTDNLGTIIELTEPGTNPLRHDDALRVLRSALPGE